MATGYLRAALAAAAAATLLTTSTGGYTAWQTAHADQTPDALHLEAGPTEVLLTPPGGTPRAVDTTHGVRAVVGETVTVRVPVTIHLGDAYQATLHVDVPAAGGDDALAAELRHNPTPVRITAADGGPALQAASPGLHVVPAAADKHTYLVEWSTSTRPTRDGRPLGADNAWGAGPASLQGLGVGARPMTLSLTPGAPPTPTPSVTTASTAGTASGTVTLSGTATPEPTRTAAPANRAPKELP